MPQPLLYDSEHDSLRDLVKAVEDRAAAEKSIRQQFAAAVEAAERDLNRTRKLVAANREKQTEGITAAHDKARQEIETRLANEQGDADQRFRDTSEKVRAETQEMEQKTRAAYQDTLWSSDAVYEGGEKSAKDRRDAQRRIAAAATERATKMRDRADGVLARVKLTSADLPPPLPQATAEPIAKPEAAIEAAFARAETALEHIRIAPTFRLASRGGFLLLVFALGIVSGAVVIVVEEYLYSLIAGLLFTFGGSLLGLVLLRSLARRKAMAVGAQFTTALADADRARQALLDQAEAEFKTTVDQLAAKRQQERRAAAEKFEPAIAQIVDRRTNDLGAAVEKHERATQRLQKWYNDAVAQAEDYYSRKLTDSNARLDAEQSEAEDRFVQTNSKAQEERDRAWEDMSQKWHGTLHRVGRVLQDLKTVARERFADWSDGLWRDPPLFDVIPRGVQFGSLEVDLTKIPNAISENEGLKPTIPLQTTWPAYLPFPKRCPLVLKVRDQARQAAVQALQAMMLRFLTGLPPGKVRFTIVDPVGLGDNFAAFMHLTDFDEQLVGARIWTEPGQIERKLADLTQHMENVIQKYLRNQYKSIEEYNEQAGEVAEPFRVLVVANFPMNFSLEACRRLVSIAASGATCGVFTLVSIDAKQAFPQGFNLADLEQASINLVWKENGWNWKDPVFERFPLALDAPPGTETLTRLVQTVGERSRDANRVEVPFEFVAPTDETVWKSSSRKGIVVPIGRSGATKRQFLSLGQGTAQHALIAGKTGSGKSTFMHALITNLALHYSPEEIELYLIDFKKGVEFKHYAAQRLPHARVVAIESEREFGLSVLQRLDGELKARGDRFREAGVNDVDSYRSARPDDLLPRILLVVDEFQEFFVEDDKVAQEAALLLDRLVRQGRAFGLHVLLGSQTLGGAYSLARSTIDQMAVRIALQCSDADAQLILSKDNTAARLLTRPGEAIYNDANGLSEGNDLFQVVWLPEQKREQYLESLRERSVSNGKRYPPPLVFEGNIPSVIDSNQPLTRLLEASEWPQNVRAPAAWLGDAVAIKDPTAVAFRPHSGNNLLMIGQAEESARSILISSLVSLAAQHAPGTAKFLLLDGTNEEDEHWGYLKRVADLLPHNVRMVDRNELAAALGEVADEVNARQKGETHDRAPRYVLVHGLHRYRDLRKAEDDFGLGRRREGPASPADSFATILREGPPVGVYLVMWCDTLSNLNRAIDRQGLRECGLRVLFQMSANDSSTLIDTPAASRLGRHRALFVTEQAAQAEKFRPYGLPSREWLDWLRQRFEQKRPSAEPVASGT
jgi:DNA segregation ATPase FtsK/SpoIIIE, S-DNA-T family